MRILVVDDDLLLADGLRRLLQAMGHAVTVANRSDLAIELLGTQEFDLVLLDWVLPCGGGQRVLAAMADGAVPVRRVVLLSGCPEHVTLSANVPTQVLPKPFRVEQLRAALSE